MEEYLMHHGIKGQKWGIRRYQNEDGSLTAAGKQRYGAHVEAVKKKVLKKQINAIYDNPNSKMRAYDRSESEKVRKQVDSSEIGKEMHFINEYLNAAQEEANRMNGGKPATLLLGKEDAELVNRITSQYINAIQTQYFTKDRMNKMALLALQDMGYEETELGREYVSSLLKEIVGV